MQEMRTEPGAEPGTEPGVVCDLKEGIREGLPKKKACRRGNVLYRNTGS